jgi:hypothetical protein
MIGARQEHGFVFENKVIASRGLISLSRGSPLDAQDLSGNYFSCKTTKTSQVCFGDAIRVLNYPTNMDSFTVVLGKNNRILF